jgi:hypothetical protein
MADFDKKISLMQRFQKWATRIRTDFLGVLKGTVAWDGFLS